MQSRVKKKVPRSLELALEHPSAKAASLSDAEAVSIAAAECADVEARISAGEIPPRPPVGPEWRSWFTEYLMCETPGHRYFIRERGSKVCGPCRSRLA